MQSEITQLIPIIKQKALKLTRPWHRFSIQECKEPLVSLEAMNCFGFTSPAPYQALGAPYGSKGPYYLREEVARRVKMAQDELQKIEARWRIKFYDAFRPVPVQEFMVAHEFYQHAKKNGVDPFTVTGWDRDKLLQEVFQFWAPPSYNSTTPPPHSTGAAFDCTIEDRKLGDLEMGSPIDHIGPESEPNYFADKADKDAADYHAHREMLYRVLSEQGFHRHPGEWWHFSYGDQMWAWQQAEQGEVRPYAIYGRAD
jgi:D-alanyl-D-alanine dipeptidase